MTPLVLFICTGLFYPFSLSLFFSPCSYFFTLGIYLFLYMCVSEKEKDALREMIFILTIGSS